VFDKLFEFISSCWQWLIPFIVLEPYHRGVITRLGKFHREIGPGFHWQWPCSIEHAIYGSVVTNTQMLAAQPLTTLDGQQISLQPLLTYHVVDVKKLYLEVEDRSNALHDTAAGVIASEAAKRTWDEVRSEAFPKEVLKAVRRRGFRYGIEVDDVQFAGLQKTRSYLLLQSHKYE